MTLPTSKQVSKYAYTRITSLFHLPGTSLANLNPQRAFKAMTRSDWNYFMLGWLGWTVDAFDFFVSSVTALSISQSFNVPLKDITWGITLVLMFRSVGAIIFGFVSDAYGRRPAFLICAAIFVCIEIGTGFAQNLTQFLVLRAIFGVSMGGMYGAASTTALEAQPIEARSMLGGIYLPGYNFGYILAIVFWRAFEDTKHHWRALFWFSAGPPALLFIWRWFTPEHPFFLKNKEIHIAKLENEGKSKIANSPILQFWDGVKSAIKQHWLLFVYLIFLMSGMNFSSHGCQDLFPTFLQKQIGLSPDARTVTAVVVNLGAMVGGLIMGQFSELVGRRIAMLSCIVGGSAFIYLAFMTKTQDKIMAGNFFLNFFVMGNWGIVSVHLVELSPLQLRSLFSGLAYQLGNLASSASSTIEADAGSKFPLEGKPGIYDYGKVMAYFMTGVQIFLFICVLVGPENFHRNLSAGAQVNKDDDDAELYNNVTQLDVADIEQGRESFEKASVHHREGGDIKSKDFDA